MKRPDTKSTWNAPIYLLAPTLFQRAQRHGVKSALLSSKKKTIQLLPAGADLVLSAEAPTPEWVQRLGPAPDIYSREINYWLLKAAIDILKNRRDITCLYVHTTDYPMHMWPPAAPESREHLSQLDQLFGEAASAAPDAAFLLSADHGMNFKSRCWDLGKACAQRGAPVRIAISVERDKYPKHHRGHGGVSWLYCRDRREIDRVAKAVSAVPGVDAVLTRSEAARRFHLLPSRIGDLVVLADKQTVFGDLDTESEALPAGIPQPRIHVRTRRAPDHPQRRRETLTRRFPVQPRSRALALPPSFFLSVILWLAGGYMKQLIAVSALAVAAFAQQGWYPHEGGLMKYRVNIRFGEEPDTMPDGWKFGRVSAANPDASSKATSASSSCPAPRSA